MLAKVTCYMYSILSVTYMCLVGVTLFSVNAAILDDILEGLVRQTSLATMVTFSSCAYTVSCITVMSTFDNRWGI